VRYTLTFREEDYAALTSHLFGAATEMGAYVLCKVATMEQETRLLAREMLTIQNDEIEFASLHEMKIKSVSFMRAMKRADESDECFVFVHSHPKDLPAHSGQDDREEPKLFLTAFTRIRMAKVHASLVLSSPHMPVGRVWLPQGRTLPLDQIRVLGQRFRFYGSAPCLQPNPTIYDRQIRAFGRDMQKMLASLTIGVVGLGGTGSCVTEQLIRLGVGNLFLFDDQYFEDSNVTRVYGSRSIDLGIPKTKILERLAADIGLGTRVRLFAGNVASLQVAKKLRECDVLFGCTDDQQGRAVLNRIAIYYYIPVFDMGVLLDSEDEIMRSICGRVTTLLPGAACLFCRRRITAEGITAESLRGSNPAEAASRRREGYLPALPERAPAVISFTTGVASSAVNELLHRLTGFMGSDRSSTETIHFFDISRVGTNSRAPRATCFCGDGSFWGRGDRSPYLDMIWGQDEIVP